MKLSIVTTLYLSAPTLQTFYERAVRTAQEITPDFEILFVNDGSPDHSLKLAQSLQLQDPRVTVINLSRNFGHHHALMAGTALAEGDHVFLIDSDLEEEPELLKVFWDTLKNDSADVVFGVQRKRHGGLFKRWSGPLFYSVFRMLSGIPLVADQVVARLMSRRYVNALLQHHERHVFLEGLWHITGFPQTAVSVEKSANRRSSYSMLRRFSLALEAIISFSDRPLFLIFWIGSAISVLGAIGVLKLTYRALAHGIPVPGWASLAVSIWFLGGLTISFIGVLGLYISRIFIESKKRPYAIIQDVYSSRARKPASGVLENSL